MVLNIEQQNSIEYILDWYNRVPKSDDDYLCTLSGFAGTGKTTLVKQLLKQIKGKVALSATTHQAVLVVSDIANFPAETIQSLLGLRPDVDLDDFNPNKPVFNIKAEEKISNYDLVLIDESSMLNKEAVKMIQDKAKEHNTRILFIGDKYQLPPVKESISRVFTLPNQTSLTTIMRQEEGNPLFELIAISRNDVVNKTDKLIPFLQQNVHNMKPNDKGEICGFQVLNSDAFYKHLLTLYYDSEYEHNLSFVKSLAWTNVTVNKANNYIRNKINKSDLAIIANDVLLGYKSISIDLDHPPFYEQVIRNSQVYKVNSSYIEEIIIQNERLKGYIIETNINSKPFFVLHPDSYETFLEIYEDKLSRAKMYKQWKQYYAFKNKIILKDNIMRGKATIVPKDIDYGYASTIHKSQGSTYKHSCIILGDIMKNSRLDERRRLLYVALSRASNTNTILWG